MALNDLLAEVELLKAEYDKFEHGNKSAGTRSRKHLQTIKKICQDLRIAIQSKKTVA